MIKLVSVVVTLKSGEYSSQCTLPCHDKMQSKTEGILMLLLVTSVLCIMFIKHLYFTMLIFLCDAVHGKQLQKLEYSEWKMHLDIVPGLCVCCSFFLTPLWLFLHHKFKTQDVWWQCWNIWSQCPAVLLISKNYIWWLDFMFNVKPHLVVVSSSIVTSGISVVNLANTTAVHVIWNTRLPRTMCLKYIHISKGLSFVGASITGRNGVTSVYMLKETTVKDINPLT